VNAEDNYWGTTDSGVIEDHVYHFMDDPSLSIVDYVPFRTSPISTVMPVESVTIAGPTAGVVNTPYEFAASVSPIVATQPITYIWQATGQLPVTHTNGWRDTVSFTWSPTGTQLITVTASNAWGTVSDTHAIVVSVYTPIPNLNIAKSVTHDTDLALGGVVTYTITLENTGDGAATNVKMSDTLPLEVDFGSWVSQGSAQLPDPPGDVITWGPHNAPSGQSYSIRFTAIVTTNIAYQGAIVTNMAEFSSTNAGRGSDDVAFVIGKEPGDGDGYEPDDTCAQASALTTDGTAQEHSFHQYEDFDWAHFTVVSGTTYVLQATSTSAGADLELELYDACGGDLKESDDNAFGNDARLIFAAPSNGNYYVKALNHDPAVYGEDVTYELSVRAQTPGGVVLIVAGHDDNYRLQENILYATNLAYRTFLNANIPQVHIRYLSAIDDDELTDANGDGVSDVYASSASANVEVAITTWAANLADNQTPFYLYLMDHGGVDVFLTHGSGDTITPDELDGWLSTLEVETGTPVSVIYEACHSGSFIDELEEISKPGRVVIASTGRLNNAYATPGRGARFSDAFFTALGQSQDLWTSFQWGVAAVEATRLWQTPWLDDNGDAVPNAPDDGNVARGRGLANFAFPGDRPPVIDLVLPPASIQDGEGIIRAQVRDDTSIARVWVEVYSPSFVEPEPAPDGTIPDLGVPEVPLTDSDGDGEYVGVYENFTEEGVYRLVAYAEDGEGNLSQPKVLEVLVRWRVYLPLVLR
jgi:uncharacterized repeat protein (TIGR01451 family)